MPVEKFRYHGTMRQEPVAGAVLAGGRGERLGGVSKALLPLGPGGSPLVAMTLRVLDAVASPVVLAGRADELAFTGRTIVQDREAGLGPLAGLEAVLEGSPHELCLVVACDMSFLSQPLLERLVALAREHAGATAVVPRTSLGLHPLHAVYRRSLLGEIRGRLARRALALHELLAATPTFAVAEEELRRYDPGLRSLENVNTPDDLARARRLLEERP